VSSHLLFISSIGFIPTSCTWSWTRLQTRWAIDSSSAGVLKCVLYIEGIADEQLPALNINMDVVVVLEDAGCVVCC
jgi:hypothetical protein